LSPRALGAEMNAIASSLYHSLHPSGTPSLLPIPLSTPSTSRRARIPEADTPPQNRPLLATPRPGCEVEESSAAAARWLGPTMAHGKDRAAVRAEIEVLRSERLAYEQEGIQTREALVRSEAYCRALEARVAVLETHARQVCYLYFVGCTLTWWKSQIRTLGPDAYTMTWSVLKKKMNDKEEWKCYGKPGLKCRHGRHHAVIVRDEKLVRVPFGNETLVFRGAKSYIGRESQLMVISCSKVQEYRAKGCHVFLAQISATKEDDESEGKHVKNVPIVQDFPEVFPKDLPGLPPARPVEFQIDLIPRAAPVARAPYRLAPPEMKEFLEQLQELSDKVS
nr:putative reverse transcriptase domain-containing protein [Tanacetum cinerariifolium]